MKFRHNPHTDRDRALQRAQLRYEKLARDILNDPGATLREREVAAATIHLGNVSHQLTSLLRTVVLIARLPREKRNKLAASILREAEDYGDKPWDDVPLDKLKAVITRRIRVSKKRA